MSEALGGLQDILARISPSSPLTLPDGTVVSGIDLAMMRIISARTPGEGGPTDARSQKLFAEILNRALTGNHREPIAFTDNGRLIYQKNGQAIDRARFAAQLAAQTGNLSFQSKAIVRLFGKEGQGMA